MEHRHGPSADDASAPLLNIQNHHISHQPTHTISSNHQTRYKTLSIVLGLLCFFFVGLVTMIFISLSSSKPDPHDIRPRYIMFNGTIYTPNALYGFKNDKLSLSEQQQQFEVKTLPSGISPFERQSAFVVDTAGRFYDVGNDSLLENIAYRNLPRVNLQGAVVSPSWADTHGHIMSYGLGVLEPDVRTAKNITQVVQMILDFCREEGIDPRQDPGYWVMGGRWDESQWSDDPNYDYYVDPQTGSHPFPTHQMLDQSFPGLGLAMKRIDGHACWVNQVVLNQVQLPDEDPPGGKIIRDKDGKPTGILVDYACDIVFNSLPAQPTTNIYHRALTQTLRDLNRRGITNIHDAMLGWSDMQLYLSQIYRSTKLSTEEDVGIGNNNDRSGVIHDIYDPFPMRVHGLIDAEAICGPFDGYRCPDPLPFGWSDRQTPVRTSNGSSWVEPLDFPIKKSDPNIAPSRRQIPAISYDSDSLSCHTTFPHSQRDGVSDTTAVRPAFSVLPIVTDTSNGRISAHGAKLIGDGALGSWGAYLTQPYTDKPDQSGYPIYNITTLHALVTSLVAQGFQMAIHAIGDGAVEEVIKTYIDVGAELPTPRLQKQFREMRHRVEHFQILPYDYDYYTTMNQWGLYPSMQPIHAVQDRSFAVERLGQQRLDDKCYMWRDTLDAFGVLPLGTDFPVANPNVIANLYAATTMQEIGVDLPPFLPNHTISIDEALMGVSYDPAFVSKREKVIGSIKKGNIADFVILSHDILRPGDSTGSVLAQTEVLATFIDGNIVYEHQSLDLIRDEDNADRSYRVIINSSSKLSTNTAQYDGKTHRSDALAQKNVDWYAVKLALRDDSRHNSCSEQDNTIMTRQVFAQQQRNAQREQNNTVTFDSVVKSWLQIQCDMVKELHQGSRGSSYHSDNQFVIDNLCTNHDWDGKTSVHHTFLIQMIASIISPQELDEYVYLTTADQVHWLAQTVGRVLSFLQVNALQPRSSTMLDQLQHELPSFPQYAHHVYSETNAPKMTSHRHAPLQSHMRYPNGFQSKLPPCLDHAPNREYARRATFSLDNMGAQLVSMP